MPNIPVNPIPSGLPTKHNYLRKATAIPTDFNPCDIILDTSTHSICSSLDQKYLYTYTIDTKTNDNYTDFFLVDNNNIRVYLPDYLQEANELMLESDDILIKVYSDDTNNITKSKDYNFDILGRQKVIYFLDNENQIIFSKILDCGDVVIFADDESKDLIPSISYNSYRDNNSDTYVYIYWDTLLSSTSNVSGATWNIDASNEILNNANKVVLYDTTKYLKNYLESLEGVSR